METIYHKGKEYLLLEEVGSTHYKLQEKSKPSVTIIVAKSTTKTEEQYKEDLKSKPTRIHVTW